MEMKLPPDVSPEDLTPARIQEMVDEQMGQDERPDQVLLRRTIEAIERNTGRFDFADEIQAAESTIQVDGQDVFLNTLQATFKIPDSVRDVEEMWTKYFESAAQQFVKMIIDGGYNVCRPYGIPDNNLTAREGVLQLFKNGEQASMYMAHKFVPGEPAHTDIRLIMLVGRKS